MTPPLSSSSAGHAYAVVNIREVEGKKLLHIKNPWNKQRWKGKWSPKDDSSWTAAMVKALHYDRRAALAKDDGEFWMDLDSAKHFYDVFHMNWNPSLFKHQYSTHYCWKQDAGPVKDLYNMGENPQFMVDIKSTG